MNNNTKGILKALKILSIMIFIWSAIIVAIIQIYWGILAVFYPELLPDIIYK